MHAIINLALGENMMSKLTWDEEHQFFPLMKFNMHFHLTLITIMYDHSQWNIFLGYNSINPIVPEEILGPVSFSLMKLIG